MKYYALFYEVVENFVERRARFREEHLRAVNEAKERGELVLAGALGEPPDGALLVFLAEDRSTVEEFARRDSYVVNGLVKKYDVRPWSVVAKAETTPSSKTPPGSILRQWTARTSKAHLPAYQKHFSNNVLPELRKLSGYLAATLSTHEEGEDVALVVATHWRDLESIRAFAGTDLENAVVSQEAAAVLSDFDRRVQHYRIAVSDSQD